jgi:hypothetical protein
MKITTIEMGHNDEIWNLADLTAPLIFIRNF